MMSKTKALSMIFTGIFLLSSLHALQAQNDPYEEPVTGSTISRVPAMEIPIIRPKTARTPVSRPTLTRPRTASRSSSSRTTTVRPKQVYPATPTSRRTTSGGFVMKQIRLEGDPIASGLLKVVCDDSILELNELVLEAIVNSSFVLSPEVQEQLYIVFRSLGGARDQNLFLLEIFEKPEPEDEGKGGAEEEEEEHGDEKKPDEGEKEEGEDFLELPPVEMISEIADRLKDILMTEFTKQQNQYRGKLEEAEAELKPLEEKMRRLNDRERELYAKAGTSSLRRNDVLKQIQSLERKRQDMEMRLVEAAAREEALQKQIANLGDQAKEKLKQDTVLEELVNILKLREEEMQTVQKMVETGRVSQNEYFKARESVAQARIELIKRQEAISKSMGGGSVMQERVKELTDIAIENAESQAVLKHIWEQLASLKAKKILELADQYEVEIALKQDSIRQSYEYAQDNIQRYRLNIQRSLVPSVSVLGGD